MFVYGVLWRRWCGVERGTMLVKIKKTGQNDFFKLFLIQQCHYYQQKPCTSPEGTVFN